jgi:hypothetical protein
LLRRRVAGLDNRGHRPRFVGYGFTRGPEIDEARTAITLSYEDIVRSDIAVEKALSMDIGQRIQERNDQCVKFALIGATSERTKPTVEALAAFIFKNHVARVVGFKHVRHGDYVRMFAAREHARFLQEPFEGPLVSGNVGWPQIAVRAIPHRKLRGKVLLDRKGLFEKLMLGEIGDAKSPSTEYRLNNISLNAGTDRKRVCSYLRPRPQPPTAWSHRRSQSQVCLSSDCPPLLKQL